MNSKVIWFGVLLILLVGGYMLLGNSSPEVETENTIKEGNKMVSEKQEMTFFITSKNPGTGANFGGLTGADQYCQSLATTAGAGDRTWRAYLSATATEITEVIHAKDRIGSGPWHNANGILIANNVAELHSDKNNINKETALSENGDVINGRGDSPNVHDILTGSSLDGTLALGESDITCSNWSAENEDGSAIVGHHDRLGPDTLETATSWNAAHGSRGCSLPNLNSTGGGGLLYCFASDSDTEEVGSTTIDSEEKVFDLTGKNFAFSATEIRVKRGDTVTINFTSEQGFHDWVVDEFAASTEKVRDTDGSTSVTFVADQAGAYEYYCSVGSHRAQGMVGNLIVE